MGQVDVEVLGLGFGAFADCLSGGFGTPGDDDHAVE